MAASIRRGLAAGLIAGLLAGLFALLVGEIPLREAIALEEQAGSTPTDSATHTHSHAHDDDALVARWVQQALLPVATALVGTAFGGLFGLGFGLLRPRLREPDPWRASLKLGTVAWLVLALFPALRYPAVPPGAGDPGRVGVHTGWFLGTLLLGGLVAVALWAVASRLHSRRVPEIPRQITVALAGALLYGGLFWALPAGGSAQALPAELVWEFRLAAMATQLIMWAGIAAGFGWLARRAATGDRFGGSRPAAPRPEPT